MEQSTHCFDDLRPHQSPIDAGLASSQSLCGHSATLLGELWSSLEKIRWDSGKPIFLLKNNSLCMNIWIELFFVIEFKSFAHLLCCFFFFNRKSQFCLEVPCPWKVLWTSHRPAAFKPRRWQPSSVGRPRAKRWRDSKPKVFFRRLGRATGNPWLHFFLHVLLKKNIKSTDSWINCLIFLVGMFVDFPDLWFLLWPAHFPADLIT